MVVARKYRSARDGGVYIAVLGSAIIIALLGMCALIGQRIENRLVTASTDIWQAQLNATTAVELALLAMKQDTSWHYLFEWQLVHRPQHRQRHMHGERRRSQRQCSEQRFRRPGRGNWHGLQRPG